MEKVYEYADFITWVDEIRCELIEGTRKIMAGVSEWHAAVSWKLTVLIDGVLKKIPFSKYFVFHAPFDVILFPEEELYKSKTVVQPDFGICLKEKRKGRVIIGAPELIIEVTSRDIDYDLIVKRELYQKAGVKEYWVIIPKEEIIIKYVFNEETGLYKKGIHYSLEDNKKITSDVIE